MIIVSLITSLLLTVLPCAETPLVSIETGKDRLLIKVGEKPLARYVWDDPSIQRPYFADLRSPGGVQVTRNLPPLEGQDLTDHATMHPGLWLAFGDLSGADFWRNKGIARHAGFVTEPTSDHEGGRFTVRNLYEADGKTICEEVCRIEIKVRPEGWFILLESQFSSPERFYFGDQEEMGLGARVATVLAVTSGGAIRDSEGRRNEKQVWGQQADWCDYSGSGGGIMLMPDPSNFRRCWFHARDYGLLVANPFGREAFTKGEKSQVVVKPGEVLTLRFGILLHDGELDREAAYQAFLETFKTRAIQISEP